MPAAARVTDLTDHPGVIDGPGVPTVLIGGKPAAVADDGHTCAAVPPLGPHPKSKMSAGNPTVLIGGKPALFVGSPAGCGAMVKTGLVSVQIG